jgi:RsiW-degrading membrane proteinase PrsW (M82 family)
VEEKAAFRRSVWASSLITLFGLALFIGISALIPRPDSSTGILLLGVFVALVPALIWLGFFYQQDRSEPEPKHLVARIFVFGALAAAVAVPLTEQIATQTISQFPSLIVRLVLTVLTISLIQEVFKVAMVRYVVLGTDQFDRHPDGIVYGLAAGLGFATVLTIAFVLRTNGVIPLAGAIRAVDNALVHGVLGAVSGYYIGRVKIDGKKLGWMARGLAIVTVVNGVYRVASDELSRSLAFNPWYSLGAAVVLALAVGITLFYFFRRALQRATGELKTVSIQIHARSKDMPWDIHVRYDWLLIGALVVALVVSLGAGAIGRSQTRVYSSADMPVVFRYPSRWAVQTGGAASVSLIDLLGEGIFKPSISVTTEKLRAETTLDFLVAERLTNHEHQNLLYTQIGRQDGLTVDGNPAIQVEYQYATEASGQPVVVNGIETYVLVGTRLYIFRYEAEPDLFESGLAQYSQLLRSVHFQAEQP